MRTWRDLLIALAEGRPSFAGETVLQTIGGERRSVLLTATFPADGVRSTVLLSAVDITERQALAEARAELAHVSRIVTLGELTTSIAHEVKQPLAAIVTDAQACLRWLDRPVPALDEARACAGRIAGQANRADHVVQRLRDLTRKAEPERVAVDANAVVDDVVELMRREIADHGVALRTRLAPGLPPVAGDRIQLQQVLINLVVNAIQAMATAPRRELTIETLGGPAGEVVVQVADSGIGLDPEAMAAPVHPVPHHQARRHGPRAVDLPLHRRSPWRADLGVAQRRGRADLPRRPAGGSEGGMTGAAAEAPLVLVLDDEDAVRTALDSLLRSVGFRVACFASPEELLHGDQMASANCLVLDIRLQMASGLDLQAQLAEAGLGIPVVFMTGHGDIPMSVRAMKAGAVDFLTKPFRDQDMLDAVARRHRARPRAARGGAARGRGRGAVRDPDPARAADHGPGHDRADEQGDRRPSSASARSRSRSTAAR